MLAGFLADSCFLTLLNWFGPYCFLLFAAIAGAGGVYSFLKVPETKGKTLAEVQALLRGTGGSDRNSEAALGELLAQVTPLRQPHPDPRGSPSQVGPLLQQRESSQIYGRQRYTFDLWKQMTSGLL